ncbi:TetR/AcrR family transcriptional regulator [Tsukamurella soli]|uniref:HTH tetR-type domain-containing protein n=1 Tax=Tsukamurella soli TaxID=644556 RepID=A0ABP8J5K3_9ACTN
MADDGRVRRGRGRPTQISRERIVDAAFAAENLDALTMRDLAARLGVTHSALYWWVRDRDELFDLVNEVMIERVLGAAGTRSPRRWRSWLAAVGWAMHDQYLAAPGYATHLSRPHRHTPGAFERMRGEMVAAFIDAGVGDELAEQSWYIFISSMVGWLAGHENPLQLGAAEPRFDLFLEALLRGLPAREPRAPRPARGG